MQDTYAAHDLSDAALGGQIRIENGRFIDNYGRTLSLRGLNVSGASKLPTEPSGLSHLTEGFYEHRTVTFVGRPFPLEEAPLHFRRLQAWGLPLIRLLVTWESIGHAGPNPNTDLDLEYIDYLRQLVELMPQYGIRCFICAHQDVWSRFSGGSGAPGWTFEAAGLDVEAFTDTGAAYVHGQDELKRSQGPINPNEPSGPFVWPSGYQKLAASTMATLFWAGDALAPQLRCYRTPFSGKGDPEEVSIQSFLQDALIEAFGRLADELGSLEGCLGFEPMNEPHRGLVNLHHFHSWNYDTDLHIGHCPSLAQALALGIGHAQKIRFYVKFWPQPTRVSHQSLVDPKGRSAWLPADGKSTVDRPHGMGGCIWQAHGVWNWDERKQEPVILDNDYFDRDHRPGHEGEKIEWYRDCYAPFLQRFSERVSRGRPKHLSFIEPIPNEFMPPWPSIELDARATEATQKQTYAVKTLIAGKQPRNLVFAPHFYDLNVLFSKRHSWMSVNVQELARKTFVLKTLYFGARGLRKNYRKQLGNIATYGQKSLGPLPVIIGEVGLPFDINGAEAYLTGCYDKQREIMNALISAMEDNFIGFTLWNYNPHNRVEYGDGWNKEDFSIINGDEVIQDGPVRPDYRNADHETDELYSGGRVLDVIIRPYAVKIAGLPLRSGWDPETLRFDFEWSSVGDAGKHDPKSRVTEFFIPSYHYAEYEHRITVSDGEWSFNAEKQSLYVLHHAHDSGTVRHSLTIEILDVREHRLARVQQRRQAIPPQFPQNLLSIEAELWLADHDLSSRFIVVGIVGLFGIMLALIFQS